VISAIDESFEKVPANVSAAHAPIATLPSPFSSPLASPSPPPPPPPP
jgi:hypothetical protein